MRGNDPRSKGTRRGAARPFGAALRALMRVKTPSGWHDNRVIDRLDWPSPAGVIPPSVVAPDLEPFRSRKRFEPPD